MRNAIIDLLTLRKFQGTLSVSTLHIGHLSFSGEVFRNTTTTFIYSSKPSESPSSQGQVRARVLSADATDERAEAITTYSEIPLLTIDDLGMRKLPANAAEDLLEIVMRRYERASTILTSNRSLDDWLIGRHSSAILPPLQHS